MFEKLEVMQMAQAMASHAAARQSLVSQNIANADTPGYAARDLPAFSEIYTSEADPGLRATRAGHIGGQNASRVSVESQKIDGSTSPDGNSVSLEDEMVRASDIRREHDLALAIYRSSLTVLRTSLGRT